MHKTFNNRTTHIISRDIQLLASFTVALSCIAENVVFICKHKSSIISQALKLGETKYTKMGGCETRHVHSSYMHNSSLYSILHSSPALNNIIILQVR